MNLFAALHEYLLERERQDYFSGVVLITQNSHELYSAAYGYASRAWKVMNSLDIRFDCASVTKIFTAVAVLQLIEQGLLTFETSAVQLLGLRDTQISEAVNVFHLLTHTSGIADDSEEEAGEDYADLWITKPNYSVLETADFLPQFVHKPPNFAPGAGCRYCNVGFTLLGLMIEKVTGMTYRSYVRKHVFERAEMWHSDFYRMDVVTENVAEGCDPIVDGDNTITGWKRNIYSYPPIGSPDGGAHVTAGDLDIFLNAIQSGKLLSAEFTADMLVPKALHHETEHYTFKCGYGLEFYLWKPDIFTYYEKDGINAGASAVMRHYPAQNLNVIMLSNMMRGVWEPVKKVHELLMTTAL
ncbi:MAG: serine hydrolase domain-containing protein [Anaerolineae bacterium]